MATFDFCPDGFVPETLVRDNGSVSVMTMNGWDFTSKPAVPFKRRFKVMLHGLYWRLDPVTEAYDATTDPLKNARRLELFYQEHEMWKPFVLPHPHLGDITCRFQAMLNVPASKANSGGLLEPLEVNFIEHNPGY